MLESRKDELNGTDFSSFSNSKVDTSPEVFQSFLSYLYRDFTDINEEFAVETLIFASGERD